MIINRNNLLAEIWGVMTVSRSIFFNEIQYETPCHLGVGSNRVSGTIGEHQGMIPTFVIESNNISITEK